MGIKVTGRHSGHLHKEEGWGTACVYGLPIAKYYYSEKPLPLTPNHWIAKLNMRSILLHEARPARHL